MSQNNAQETVVTDSTGEEIERISWGEYIRNQFKKVLAFLAMLVILFYIILLSDRVTPPGNPVNPPNVISIANDNYLGLMVVSSVLFIIVLVAFTKLVLVDHKEEFGIESWKSPKAVITLVLVISFISLVHILLDVSLINIYLMTFPVWVIWQVPNYIPALSEFIPSGIDRLAYSDIRSMYFVFFLSLLFIFPLTMFIWILSRYGRRFFKERTDKWKRLPIGKLLVLFVVLPVIAAALFYLFQFFVIDIEIVALLVILAIIVLGFVWLIVILLLLVGLIRVTLFLTYSNFLLIFPIIFLFYVVPGLLWGIWDLLVIVNTGGIENTIYATDIGQRAVWNIDPNSDITALSGVQLVNFYLQTVRINLRHVIRLVELDFVILVGISAVVIGFAEGYSIFAIVKSIATGVSIAKSGRVAKRSAPKMVVISTRLIYLMAWLSFLWDKAIVIARALANSFQIDLPIVDFPEIFTIIIDFALNIGDISEYLLVFTVLAVPFYFIIASAFKFLSVSLALERFEEDRTAYFLLISSAFILIVTNILADIASLPAFITDHRPYLPLANLATTGLLPFASNILDLIESVAFYGGVIFSIFYGLKKLLIKDEEEEVESSHTIDESETIVDEIELSDETKVDKVQISDDISHDTSEKSEEETVDEFSEWRRIDDSSETSGDNSDNE